MRFAISVGALSLPHSLRRGTFGARHDEPQSQAVTFDPSLFSELRWRNIGPFRGGRTKAVDGIPAQPNVFYIGAVNGGVWKTNDFGRTWAPIFDDQPTGSIGAIAIAPSNPNIIYVGSGEGMQRPDLSTGDGIYKSTDAGKTWTHLGLRDGQQIPQIIVDPKNPDRLFVAVLGHPYGPNPERGIFRSIDGGRTFEKVLYRDENTGGIDLAFDPVDRERRLCRAAGIAAGAVGERRLDGAGQRPLQIHRRRHDLAAAHAGAADVCGRARPHRHHRRAERSHAPVRRRRCARARRHLPIGRCGRDVVARQRGRARRRAPGRRRRHPRASHESRHRLRAVDRHVEVDRWRPDVHRLSRRARRRRLSEDLDQSRAAGRDDPDVRPGRDRHASTAARRGAPGTTSRRRSSTT